MVAEPAGYSPEVFSGKDVNQNRDFPAKKAAPSSSSPHRSLGPRREHTKKTPLQKGDLGCFI